MPHTPGPWTLVIEGVDRYIIAPGVSHRMDALMGSIISYHPMWWCPHSKADWHLISAAPELLTYCKQLYVVVPNPDLKRVIDKAEGREVDPI